MHCVDRSSFAIWVLDSDGPYIASCWVVMFYLQVASKGINDENIVLVTRQSFILNDDQCLKGVSQRITLML